MDPLIVADNTIMTLLGPVVVNPQTLNQVFALAPILVAADGGGNVAATAQMPVRAVIGDMDSITENTRTALADATFIQVNEQETTDFEKCLQRISAPVVLAIGFVGGRIDHELATFNALLRYPDQRIILVGDEDVIFLAPRQIELALPVGTRLSLFPLAPVKGWSGGLNWPIEGVDFAPDGPIGVSNRTVKAQVSLRFEAQKMLAILPIQHLQAAIDALYP